MVCIILSPLLFALCSHSQITFDRGRAETPDPVQQLWWTETQPEPIRLRGHCLSHPSFSLKTAKGCLPRAAFHSSQVHFSTDVQVGGASIKSPVRCLLIPGSESSTCVLMRGGGSGIQSSADELVV